MAQMVQSESRLRRTKNSLKFAKHGQLDPLSFTSWSVRQTASMWFEQKDVLESWDSTCRYRQYQLFITGQRRITIQQGVVRRVRPLQEGSIIQRITSHLWWTPQGENREYSNESRVRSMAIVISCAKHNLNSSSEQLCLRSLTLVIFAWCLSNEPGSSEESGW